MATSDDAPDANELLDIAYSVETPDDNRNLYQRWATTYDADFIEATGYVYHENVAHAFIDAGGGAGGAIADVGCGTGVIGVALGDMGEFVVDGLDISTEMLTVAASKRTVHGHPAYRNLIEADLTTRVPIEDDTYMGVVSSGTFTHGHLGPEALSEVIRVASPAAVCAIGINEHHYVELGFERWFADAANAGLITVPDLVSVAIFERFDGGHAGTRGALALFQVRA